MDLNRFTEKMQEALQSAQSRAIRRSHQQLDVEHLLAALLEQESGLAGAILAKAGASAELLGQRLEQELDRMPKVTGPTGAPPDQIYVTGRLNRVLTLAEDEAKKLKDEYVSVEHVLLAITEDKGPAGRLLAQMGVTRDKLMQALREVRGSQRVTSPTPEATYQALERYGRDLTEAARQGKLDPVIGRDDEIRRVIQVLSRRTKNNPVLIGDRKSTRLNSSHANISYAVFCLKKKKLNNLGARRGGGGGSEARPAAERHRLHLFHSPATARMSRPPPPSRSRVWSILHDRVEV